MSLIHSKQNIDEPQGTTSLYQAMTDYKREMREQTEGFQRGGGGGLGEIGVWGLKRSLIMMSTE